MEFYIKYNTGAGNKLVEVESLSEAKEIAEDGMSYTQQNVDILDEKWNHVTTSRWYGVEPAEDVEDHVLLEIGGGYYGVWE